ncbi:putative holin-like toxin [Clostridium beijerinckii]|uniref:putative holin-like toxin n=1 Tax=Clostridium beijerinckii TaxID=1520 RepID=UPI001F424D15|nr:putative holin-like toxin [Clostridium beijerinckii]
MILISNDILTLLFQGGLFLISLLTLIVVLIEKNLKKIVAQGSIGRLLFFK